MKTIFATSMCLLAAGTVAGCASAPEVRFPSGSAPRVAVGSVPSVEMPADNRIDSLQQSVRTLKANVNQLQDELRKRNQAVPPSKSAASRGLLVATVGKSPATAPGTHADGVVLESDALFASGKSSLDLSRGDQQHALADFAASLMTPTQPIARLVIVGHTDSIGASQHNKQLSLSRAKSIRSYLFDAGVRVPIDVSGAGGTDPVVKCGNEAGASLLSCLAPNRRVTVRIINKAT